MLERVGVTKMAVTGTRVAPNRGVGDGPAVESCATRCVGVALKPGVRVGDGRKVGVIAAAGPAGVGACPTAVWSVKTEPIAPSRTTRQAARRVIRGAQVMHEDAHRRMRTRTDRVACAADRSILHRHHTAPTAGALPFGSQRSFPANRAAVVTNGHLRRAAIVRRIRLDQGRRAAIGVVIII